MRRNNDVIALWLPGPRIFFLRRRAGSSGPATIAAFPLAMTLQEPRMQEPGIFFNQAQPKQAQP